MDELPALAGIAKPLPVFGLDGVGPPLDHLGPGDAAAGGRGPALERRRHAPAQEVETLRGGGPEASHRCRLVAATGPAEPRPAPALVLGDAGLHRAGQPVDPVQRRRGAQPRRLRDAYRQAKGFAAAVDQIAAQGVEALQPHRTQRLGEHLDLPAVVEDRRAAADELAEGPADPAAQHLGRVERVGIRLVVAKAEVDLRPRATRQHRPQARQVAAPPIPVGAVVEAGPRVDVADARGELLRAQQQRGAAVASRAKPGRRHGDLPAQGRQLVVAAGGEAVRQRVVVARLAAEHRIADAGARELGAPRRQHELQAGGAGLVRTRMHDAMRESPPVVGSGHRRPARQAPSPCPASRGRRRQRGAPG